MLSYDLLAEPANGPFPIAPMSPASDASTDGPQPADGPLSGDSSDTKRVVASDDAITLFQSVRAELSGMANRLMARQPVGHTLQATALVNEAYLRMSRRPHAFEDRNHFLRIAAQAMRQILVDSGRRRRADKRPPKNRRVDLDLLVSMPTDVFEERSGGLEELHLALGRLEEVDPSLAEFVELRFFGGQTMTACAEILGLSERQAFRRWRAARAFLARDLERQRRVDP